MTATTAPATTAVLSLQGVSKRFGAVQHSRTSTST